MQVARNFFLTREKTLTRKLREVLLAWKIEANLSKDEILELYVNQIFLGQRAYGFAAASQIYFGKPLKDLSVAEAAMLAGPARRHRRRSIRSPTRKRARTRQQYVLRRMHDLKYITTAEFEQAQGAPLAVQRGRARRPARARRVRGRDGPAGRVRRLRGGGLHARASPSGRRSAPPTRRPPTTRSAAALVDYDRRHGYRGPEAYVSLPDDKAAAEPVLERVFQEHAEVEGFPLAVVLAAGPTAVEAMQASGDAVEHHRRRAQVRDASAH